MANGGAQSRRWCFTLNNPTDEEIAALSFSGGLAGTSVGFICWGREHFEPGAGTPHLQGYVEFKTKLRIGGIKKLAGFGRAHLESARGSAAESIAYCGKEDPSPFRAGEPYDTSGGRGGREAEQARWEAARKSAESQRLDEIPADIYLRYKRSFDEIAATASWDASRASRPRLEYQLRPWQSQALGIVKAPVDDRKVYFFLDCKGGAGKSFFCQHVLRDEIGVVVLRPARSSDLAYLIRKPPRVVVFDCPRSSGYSDMPWDFIEGLKDGHIVSTKYTCEIKDFCPATVIIMCNTKLWLNADGEFALSEDRMVIEEIKE